MSSDTLGVSGRSVDAGADRGRSHVDLAYQRLRFAKSVDILEYRMGEGVELLAERHRHCILQLSASHLDECRELFALVEERRRQRDHRQLQIGDARVEGELHRRRIHVVGRLTEVEMIVGMDDVVLAAFFAEYLERAIGHDLVGVHVRRRSGSALNHVDAEMLVVLSLPDLSGRL